MQIDAKGPEGNVLAIVGHVSSFLKMAGRKHEISSVQQDMMSGDYDHACDVAKKVTHGAIQIVNR